MLAWFTREPFVYTLAPPLLDRDPVDGFLFDTRRGFCEHYASAFVVLLRAAGIPARVVTGYQGGEINPRGGYMIVRQSDAHAWAEALVDGEWRRYDPTAAVSPSRIELGLGGALPTSDEVPLLARLDVGWLKAVAAHVGRGQPRLAPPDHRLQLRQSALALAGLERRPAGGVAVRDARRGVRAGVGRRSCSAGSLWQRRRHDRARAHWHALCTRLARAGLPRLPHEGPLDYARAGRGALARIRRRLPWPSAKRMQRCATAPSRRARIPTATRRGTGAPRARDPRAPRVSALRAQREGATKA